MKSFITHTPVVSQSILERTLTRHSACHGPQTKRLTFVYEPVSKAVLDQLTQDLALYQALHPKVASCGGWWSYANGRWALETCADKPECCVCHELLKRSQQETVGVPATSTKSEAGPSTNGESKQSILQAAIKSKQEDVSTLTELLTKKQDELEALRNKLNALDELDTTSSGTSIPTFSEPTTPSWLLAKSVKQVTSLKTIVEDDESDFSGEFSQPLPAYYPLSLVRREQRGELFQPRELTAVVSPSAFQVPYKNNSSEINSTGNGTAAGYDQQGSSNPSEPVTKVVIQEVTQTAPTIPTHHSDQTIKSLNTAIRETEKSDVLTEFSQPLPTCSPHSPVRNEQQEKVFEPSKVNTVTRPSSFNASSESDLLSSLSCSSSNVCSPQPIIIASEPTVSKNEPAHPAPSNHVTRQSTSCPNHNADKASMDREDTTSMNREAPYYVQMQCGKMSRLRGSLKYHACICRGPTCPRFSSKFQRASGVEVAERVESPTSQWKFTDNTPHTQSTSRGRGKLRGVLKWVARTRAISSRDFSPHTKQVQGLSSQLKFSDSQESTEQGKRVMNADSQEYGTSNPRSDTSLFLGMFERGKRQQSRGRGRRRGQ